MGGVGTMLTSVKMQSVFDADTCAKLEKHISRRSGGIELFRVRRLVELVAAQKGQELHLPEKAYRSCYRPEMLDVPKEKFLAAKRFQPDRKRLNVAVSRVRKKLKKMGQVDPITVRDSYELLLSTKAEKSAGLPTMGKKRDDVHLLERAEACAKGKCPPPAVFAHRGKNTEVARIVWMIPAEWQIIEGVFFFPLQEKFKRNVSVYAAENAVNRRAIFNELVASGQYFAKLAMDYSGFDATIGSQLIGIAFDLLHDHLKLDVRLEKLWSRVATYFATCPFVDQYGNVISGRKGGVPSGSMFTQMVDTVVNAIVIEYIFTDEQELKYFVYGDDSLTFLQSSLDEVNSKLELYKSQAWKLGIIVNLKKTHVCAPSEPTIFLGHYDLHSGRPLDEVLTRLIYPERAFKVDATNLSTRVAAYMAEDDAVMGILLPVYRMIKAIGDSHARADIESFSQLGMSSLTTVELGKIYPYNLTGLAQFLANEDPALTNSFWRMRASV